MSYRIRSYSILLGLLLGYTGLCAVAQVPRVKRIRIDEGLHPKRPVTVGDVIGMTNIGDSSYHASLKNESKVVEFSPDGSKFVFVTQKGDLKSDTVQFSLLVFKTADVFSSSHSEVIATLASSSNRPAISRLTWLPDNDTIIFLGEHPGEYPQLYRVSSTTKEIARLTNQPKGVLAYSINDKGDSFVYLAGAGSSSGRSISSEMYHRGFTVTSQRWDDLYTGRRPASINPMREIFVKTNQMKVPQRLGGILPVPGNADGTQAVSISPNGRYALITSFNLTPPTIWRQYDPGLHIKSPTTSCTETEAYLCPTQYLLLDIQKKTVEPLINAPVMSVGAGRELFTWTHENSVLLVNALLPLDSVDVKEREERHSSIYAAEITVPERKIVEIAQRKTPLHAFKIHPGTLADQFITDPIIVAYGPPLEFRRGLNGWKVAEAASVPTEPALHLSVMLDEDMNSAPKLVAHDATTKRKAVLLDLNPQFAGLTFGRVEAFKWTTSDGYPLEGSLYFPPDYVPGRRYPLVIQTHGYNKNRFWPDGPYTTAFAAQPLANRGFLVLQIPTVNPYTDVSIMEKAAKVFDTAAEGPYSEGLFDSAIDELDRLGLVDPTRVGLTGFSRTVYHVLYTLTHSGHHFAAAVAADGVNFGYTDCIYYFAKSDSGLCEKMNGGGPPFGASLAGWAKATPTFNLDKVQAPLLLQAITAPLGEWEILAGLGWLKKPVEMVNFYPEGEHELVRPQQRLLSEGSVVDWYGFWLKNEEDSDPAKAEQYARWRQMKHQRDDPKVEGIR